MRFIPLASSSAGNAYLVEAPGGGTAASGNASLLEELPEGEDGRDNPFLPFRVGAFDILPFPTFHDAEQSVGYLIRAGGEKLAFATDTVSLPQRFPGVNILALEANYDYGQIRENHQRFSDRKRGVYAPHHAERYTGCNGRGQHNTWPRLALFLHSQRRQTDLQSHAGADGP